MGLATGGPSIVVGRDVSRSLLVLGDHNQIFTGIYESLRDAYIEPRSVFKRVDFDHFTGRDWLLQEVDAFLGNNDCGYFVLEAEAGLGKTAFLAWLVRKRGYIHHFVELAPGSAGVGAGLKNLAAQLILAYPKPDAARDAPLPAVAVRPDYLDRLLRQSSENRREGEKIVLVVDALDEAGTWPRHNALCLPEVLPEGVFFIVSKRPVPVVLYVDTHSTPRHVFHLRADSDKNRDDMQGFLTQAVAWRGIAKALTDNQYTQKQFISTLMEKCQGVWAYLGHVIHEIEQGERSPLDLDTLPDGMTQYYVRYWRGWRKENEDKWDAVHLPLIATLAAAREPITVECLAKWANVKMPTEGLRRLLCEDWRHFIAIVSHRSQERYQFYHATLRDFCEGQVGRDELTDDEWEFVCELRRATVNAYRRIMQEAQEPEVRRDAALRLTRLDWLAYVDEVSTDERLICLELIAPLVSSVDDREYLVQRCITPVLVSGTVNLSDRQRAQFLTYRAGILGALGRSEEAAGDYEEAKSCANVLFKSPDYLLEDHKLVARINLGLGGVASTRAEELERSEDQECRRGLLEEAVKSYSAAVELAQVYGQDAALEARIYKELSWAYALLQRWEEAEQSYRTALEAVERVRDQDQEAYANCRALVLETAGEVHREWGQALISEGNSALALSEYETAHKYAQEEITLLEPHPGESRDLLVIAHINDGEYLLAMHGCPDCEATLLAQACEHWRTALNMARGWGFENLEQVANRHLEQHCGSEACQPGG